MNAGISFSPLGQQGGQAQGNGQNNTATPPVQDAIRLLSLKLPSVLGPTAPSGVAFATPSALGPQLGSALAQNWLRGLFSPSTPVQSGASTPNGDLSDLFAQLMTQIGAPSFASSAPGATPAAGRTSVKLEAPNPSQATPIESPTDPTQDAMRVPHFGMYPPIQYGQGTGGFMGGPIQQDFKDVS